MAVACDQTRVFNMAYFAVRRGHQQVRLRQAASHGIARGGRRFETRLPAEHAPGSSGARWRAGPTTSAAFSKVKEGDGTLLDNMLIYASTDQSLARIHSIDNQPMFTAGRAGGRVKTGLHIDGSGTASTRWAIRP